jgi:hypothetical protein
MNTPATNVGSPGSPGAIEKALDSLLQISTREFLAADLERSGAESGVDQPFEPAFD